jgi:hypothetical protein
MARTANRARLESGATLPSPAVKAGRFLPESPHRRYDVLQVAVEMPTGPGKPRTDAKAHEVLFGTGRYTPADPCHLESKAILPVAQLDRAPAF